MSTLFGEIGALANAMRPKSTFVVSIHTCTEAAEGSSVSGRRERRRAHPWSITSGSKASARAMPTRCFIPPERR